MTLRALLGILIIKLLLGLTEANYEDLIDTPIDVPSTLQETNQIDELEFIKNIKDYTNSCNLYTLDKLVLVLESNPNETKIVVDYFEKCANIFDERVRKYLSTMKLVGEVTSDWLEQLFSFINQKGYRSALNQIRRAKRTRALPGFGDILLTKVSTLPKRYNFGEKDLIWFESFFYGESLCFHANQPPMSYMREFITIVLEKFHHLPEIMDIFSSPFEETNFDYKKRNFSNFYLLQSVCQNFRETAVDYWRTKRELPFDRGNPNLDEKRRELIAEALPQFQSSGSNFCSREQVYLLKWAWQAMDLLNQRVITDGYLRYNLLAKIEQVFKECVEEFERSVKFLFEQPKEIEEAINLWKNIARANQDDAINKYNFEDTYASYLHPRLETQRQINYKRSLYYRLEADTVNCFGNLLSCATRERAFLRGRGLCDNYLDKQEGQEFGNLLASFEVLEQFASFGFFNMEFAGMKNELIDNFHLYIICRSLRISPVNLQTKSDDSLSLSL